MKALSVIEAEVQAQLCVQFWDETEVLEIDQFVFYRSPEALDEHIVYSSAFAIHADLDPVSLQDRCEIDAIKCLSLRLVGAPP